MGGISVNSYLLHSKDYEGLILSKTAKKESRLPEYGCDSMDDKGFW